MVLRQSSSALFESISTATKSTLELGTDFREAVVHDERSIATQLRDAMTCTKPRRCCSEALVWSNLVLALPVACYLAAGHVIPALLLALSASTSLLYHFHFERHAVHLLMDRGTAIISFFGTLPVTWSQLGNPAKIVSVCIVAMAFYFKHHQDLNYRWYHSAWHLSIAAGQLFLSLHLMV